MPHGRPPAEKPFHDGPIREEFNQLLHMMEAFIVDRNRKAAPPPLLTLAPVAALPFPPTFSALKALEIDSSNVVKFRRLGPLNFKGRNDPTVLDQWIRSIEKIFFFLGLNF